VDDLVAQGVPLKYVVSLLVAMAGGVLWYVQQKFSDNEKSHETIDQKVEKVAGDVTAIKVETAEMKGRLKHIIRFHRPDIPPWKHDVHD